MCILVVVVLWILTSRSERFGSVEPKCPKAQKESRRLWYEHVRLTRIYLVKYLDDLPDLEDATNVLMRNQEDIGSFIDSFVPGTGEAVTNLLKEHILGAVEILKDTKEGRNIEQAVAEWYVNADAISKALAPILGLPEDKIKEMMHYHLKTTLDEATYHLTGDYESEEKAYCAVVKHIIEMADYLVSNVPCSCNKR